MKRRTKQHFVRGEIEAPDGLLLALRSIFPNLWICGDALVAEIAAGEIQHHGILLNFRSRYRDEAANPRQLQALARLIALSLSVADELENA